MSRKQDQELNQNVDPDSAPEAPPDDLADIEPAELYDPEEFGVHRRP